MVFRSKTKKRPASRFVHATFQRRVKRASGYQRNGQGWKRDLQVYRALVSRIRVWPLLLGFFASALLGVAVYYPPMLHIRRIDVSGLPTAWAEEVRHQVERYIEENRFFLLPQRNLAVLDAKGLAAYVTTVNAHVERVSAVVRHWPHTVEIQAVPRVPAYAWSLANSGVPILISNDGKVLPDSERGDRAPLRLYGSAVLTSAVGGQALSGELLEALDIVRTQFVERTGLAALSAVRLVPLVAVTPSPTGGSGLISPTASIGLAPITHELWVEVGADATYKTPAFVVLLDTNTVIPEALDRLHALLEKQSLERRAELLYVDLRFSARAYVCVRSAACAATGLREPALVEPH